MTTTVTYNYENPSEGYVELCRTPLNDHYDWYV